MIFEHFALNVLNPLDAVKWYCTFCGMKILRGMDNPPFTHFLADSSGRPVLEIYSNKSVELPDYASQHPLEFHFAFNVDDASGMKDKLISAGAKLIEEINTADGSHIVTLRDPFGICLQLCKRAKPLQVSAG